jgi:hypothetical protein
MHRMLAALGAAALVFSAFGTAWAVDEASPRLHAQTIVHHCFKGVPCGNTCIPKKSICHKPKPPPQEQPCRDMHGRLAPCEGRHPA